MMPLTAVKAGAAQGSVIVMGGTSPEGTGCRPIYCRAASLVTSVAVTRRTSIACGFTMMRSTCCSIRSRSAMAIGDSTPPVAARCCLRTALLSYKTYYNETRTHLSLNKDAPSRRVVQAAGLIFCQPILGGLHHQYGRI
jgi:hypothetical protein